MPALGGRGQEINSKILRDVDYAQDIHMYTHMHTYTLTCTHTHARTHRALGSVLMISTDHTDLLETIALHVIVPFLSSHPIRKQPFETVNNLTNKMT